MLPNHMDFQKSFLAELETPIDVTDGGVLEPHGTQLAKLYRPEHTARRTIGQRLHEARTALGLIMNSGELPAIIPDTIAFASAAIRRRATPPDTQFLTGHEPALNRQMPKWMLGALRRDSRIIGQQHLAEAAELKSEGEPVTIEMVPHTSLVDPFVVQALLHKTMMQNGDQQIAEACRSILRNMVVMIGQKVQLSHMQRLFASAYHTLVTIAPKYRKVDPNFNRAHNRVMGQFAQALQTHPRYWLSMFPEAGRTKNNQIGVPHLLPATLSSEEWRVPMFLDIPPYVLDPDRGFALPKDFPAQLYVGKPYQPANDRRQTYMINMREKLSAMGAPVDQYQWGVYEPDRTATPTTEQLRNSGHPEVFREQVA